MSTLRGILLLKSIPRIGAPAKAVADSVGPFPGGSTQFLDVLANDLNVPPTPDITIWSQPAAGLAQAVNDLTPDAKIQFDCASPANQTSYTFQYSLNESPPVTVTVIVAGAAAGPIAVDDSFGPFLGGSTQLLNVLANDGNLGSRVITVLSQPAAGSASVVGQQVQFICATPVSQTDYTFTYSVDGSNAATVTVTVSGQVASNATIYLSPTGTDAPSSGSSGAPYHTLAYALTQNPSIGAGGTIILKAGTYTEAMVVTKGGSASAPLTVQAETRGTALIRPTSGYSAFVIWRDYTTIDGLDVTMAGAGTLQAGGNGHGIDATWLDGQSSNARGPHHVTVRHCICNNNPISGISMAYGDHYLIEYNTTSGNCNKCPNSIQGSGISIYQARASDSASGIHNIVHSNKSYNNQIIRLTNGIGGAGYTQPGSEPDHTDGNGIIIDDLRNTQGGSTAGVFAYTTLVENNLCYGNGNRGIHVFISDNVVVKNNTCYRNNQDLYSVATWRSELSNAYGSHNTWANNIGMTDPTTAITSLNPPQQAAVRTAIGDNDSASGNGRNSGQAFYNNLTYNGTSNTSLNQTTPSGTLITTTPYFNKLGVNPLFTAPGITGTPDFTLQAASPAIDAGTAAFGVATFDLAGNARVAGPSIDIGAYEAPPPAPAGINIGAFQIFTPAQVRLTTLSGWPAGRTPASMVSQGANAHGYVRRSWKPNNADGTYLDVMPGWQPTSAAGTMRLQLDNGSQIDLNYTVSASSLPTATKVLDSTGGGTYTTWASAIAGLVAGDVLVVRARAGTRVINGRAIPYSTYPIDVGGSGTATSTVSNVTIYADPTDLAAGRRPRIHINGSDLAGFYDDPNGMWELDPSDPAGNCYRSTRSTYTQTDSQNIWWRGSTGRVVGGYAYFCTTGGNGETNVTGAPSFLNQLRDTAYAKADMYFGRHTTYVGPGITFNGGRYYVRLSPPPLSTIVKGARTTTPWYWTDYYPPGTNPNTVPLYVSSANDGTNQACLTIDNTTGWKIYNLDFVCGHFGIKADSTSNFQVWGCRFIGASQGDHPNTDNGNGAQGKQLRMAGTTSNFLADHCEFYGGCPPWFTWSEGKGWSGSHATGLRNGAFYFINSTNPICRHCHFEGFFSLMLFDAQKDQRFHHCNLLNIGPFEGAFVTNVPSGLFEFIRNRHMNSTMAGWSGGPSTIGNQYVISCFISTYLAGSAAHKALHTKNPNSGGSPTSLDCDFFPCNLLQPHGGFGANGIPSEWRLQCSIVGTQRSQVMSASGGGNYGSAAPLGSNALYAIIAYRSGGTYTSENNLAAVYPSDNGYIWSTCYTNTVSAPSNLTADSHCCMYEKASIATYDYNHIYRSPSMPSTGRTALATVSTYNVGGSVACANMAAVQAQGVEVHGTSSDPGWTVTYPRNSSDSLLYNKANFIPTGTATTGGNTGLSGQGAHDFDMNTQITYPGYSWRGCFVPGVPAIEQEVGPCGPLPSGSLVP